MEEHSDMTAQVGEAVVSSYKKLVCEFFEEIRFFGISHGEQPIVI
jgi:hypothetical protein